MRAQMTSVQGERLSVGGFMAVSRAKLRALSGDTLQPWQRPTSWSCSICICTRCNFSEVKDRLAGATAQGLEAAPQGAPVH
jgi:hypothetical protein